MTDFHRFLLDIGFDLMVDMPQRKLRLLPNMIKNYCDSKYGLVPGPYFNRDWTVNRSIKRGGEGLDVHHMMEYSPTDTEICSLSCAANAQAAPYEYQLPQNLVFMNWIEHQAMHAVIDTLRTRDYGEYRPGCVQRRAPMLNKFFDNGEDYLRESCSRNPYFARALRVIEGELDTYNLIMNSWSAANFIPYDWQLLGYVRESEENCFLEEDD